jgi:hypothetical protein
MAKKTTVTKAERERLWRQCGSCGVPFAWHAAAAPHPRGEDSNGPDCAGFVPVEARLSGGGVEEP